ncbi:VanZ family protein [Bradyrhizobium lablabi]|uniref:VanZ family protein n=1 Tax=Bradyrhizobium lablabi TaxID=722472 RepID=UPI001BA45764|nr:VanZ family protein [Bradyrhizobium lablabi]MBR0697770.1 VanZ family protein [Bradyrhizobium lablabi]
MTSNGRTIARLVAALAWVVVAAIAFATLTNVGFVYWLYFKLSPFLLRPDVKTYVYIEHVAAFAVLGILFTIAYPRRTLLVCVIVIGGAAVLEVLQTLTPDRHGTLVDALQKMAGGGAGILLTKGTMRLFSAARRKS